MVSLATVDALHAWGACLAMALATAMALTIAWWRSKRPEEASQRGSGVRHRSRCSAWRARLLWRRDVPVSTVDLLDLIDDLYASLHADAQQRHLHLDRHAEPGAPAQVSINEPLLRSTLGHMLKFALVTTSAGFIETTLHAPQSRRHWRVSVRSSSDLAARHPVSDLLERPKRRWFSRGTRSADERFELWTARQTAQGLGGDLQAVVGNDGSTTVTLSLDAPVVGVISVDGMARVGQVVSINDRYVRHRRQVGRLKVLVVDDQRSSVLLISNILQRAGHQVMPVESGEAAVQQLMREHFDIAFVDLTLPGMQGVELLRSQDLSPEHANARTPMIVITGDTSLATQEECQRAGARGYVTKPVSAEQLLDVIEAVHQVETASRTVAAPLVNNADEARAIKLRQRPAITHVNNAKRYLDGLDTAIQSEDWSVLKLHARSMLGVSQVLDVPDLNVACRRLLGTAEPDLAFVAAGLVYKVAKAYERIRVQVLGRADDSGWPG